MKKSILNKDIWLSFRQSKGRFLSIMFLMMLGSFALVGLKAASPDIENSANRYLSQMKMMDLAVMSDYGISKADQKELNAVPNAQVEYGYFTDTVVGDSSTSVRVFLRQLIFLSSSLSQVIFQARKIKWLWLVFIKESTRLAIALL